MKVEKSTIMPDGRPLYAWENELKMLRSQEGLYLSANKRMEEVAITLKIAKIYFEKRPNHNSIIIRIDRFGLLQPDFKRYPEKYCQVITEEESYHPFDSGIDLMNIEEEK